MRRFLLARHHDVSGVSGTGIVADGVAFPDGVAVIRWRGEHQSTVVWPSVEDVEAIHGHNGATHIEWIDAAPGHRFPLWEPTTECACGCGSWPHVSAWTRLLRWLRGAP